MKKIEFEGGKYTIVQHPEAANMRDRYEILRYGVSWFAAEQDLIGNKFQHHVLDALFEMKDRLDAAEQEFSDSILVMDAYGKIVNSIPEMTAEERLAEEQRLAAEEKGDVHEES